MGGLLVAVAAVGVFATVVAADASPTTPYVVAAHDLEPGRPLTPADLATAGFRLAPASADRSFTDVGVLVGASVVAPVSAGELLQRSDVVPGVAVPGGAELSFAVPASRALAGSLDRGERVDVVATSGSGTTACTERVAAGARVLAVEAGSGALGGGDTVVLRVLVGAGAEALRLAHAAQASELTIVRTSGEAVAADSGGGPEVAGDDTDRTGPGCGTGVG